MTEKRSIGSNILVVLLAIAFLIPFIIMVTGSLMKLQSPFGNPFTWLFSGNLSKVNYDFIFRFSQYPKWMWNSIVISVIPTVSQMFFAAILGYIFSKKYFIGREFLFWLMMAIIMVPTQILIIPRYIMFSKFGWINTYLPLIVPQLWSVMGVFLVRQFMNQLPKELEEAAYIDGANDFQIFFKIFLPLCKPVIATVGTFAFIACWNDLLTPLIFTTSEDMYPVTVGLASMLTKEGNFGIQMGGSVLSFVPTFVIFIIFQRYFTEGIAFSGNK
jgi:multiple sugar transport system permease protein